MKVIVTGAKGQLGYDVIKRLESQGVQAIAADLPEVDISDAAAVEAFVASHKPDGVIHCAAYTAVDNAESEKDICSLVNETGTLNIAKACKNHGCKLIYISTDYVFSGKGESEFETDSPKAPCNHYGASKLAGEVAALENCDKCFVVRISWVFGINGKNFVKTMLRLSETRDELTVVNDQVGSPTYTYDLAILLCEMIKSEKYGVYHATNEGLCTWAEFASEIMRLADRKTKIIPVTSAEYKTAAVRPLNSRMSKKSLDENGFERLPTWQDALARYIELLEDF
ncbi:MAG: dTDP-4-dehydrorhamnose reductase [Clostridia bacterium]|nr:dTDP-4-dehydrorhamnose reductase [Clostridia bacterium]